MVNTTDKVLFVVLALALLATGTLFVSAGGLTLFKDTDAKQVALNVVPGEVKEVESEYVNGATTYEVEIATNNGNKEVMVDQNGRVVSISDEDDEDEEKDNDENESPITGNALEQASRAALAHIGEGRVTDSEIGDEEGYYEIEITLDNGDEVDVHLDENFKVLSTEFE